MKNVIKLLAKSVLIPLGLTAAASATEAGIHKRILGSGNNTTLIMKYIIEIVKSLEDSGLLLKGGSKQFKMKLTSKKKDFLESCLVHWV